MALPPDEITTNNATAGVSVSGNSRYVFPIVVTPSTDELIRLPVPDIGACPVREPVGDTRLKEIWVEGRCGLRVAVGLKLMTAGGLGFRPETHQDQHLANGFPRLQLVQPFAFIATIHAFGVRERQGDYDCAGWENNVTLNAHNQLGVVPAICRLQLDRAGHCQGQKPVQGLPRDVRRTRHVSVQNSSTAGLTCTKA